MRGDLFSFKANFIMFSSDLPFSERAHKSEPTTSIFIPQNQKRKSLGGERLLSLTVLVTQQASLEIFLQNMVRN